MANYELDIPMPDTYKSLLVKIVQTTIEKKTLSFRTMRTHDSASSDEYILFDEKIDLKNIEGRPLRAFCIQGLLDIEDHGNSIPCYYITPKGYQWFEYQKKTEFLKCLARRPSMVKDIMLAVSFLLSLSLTILQIVEKVIPSTTP